VTPQRGNARSITLVDLNHRPFLGDSPEGSRGWAIARHVRSKSGRKRVLFTTRRYSVTTSGHCSSVRQAIPSETLVFDVPNLGGDIHLAVDHAETVSLSNGRTSKVTALGCLLQAIWIARSGRYSIRSRKHASTWKRTTPMRRRRKTNAKTHRERVQRSVHKRARCEYT
jgi:hypothetical protein